MPKSSESQTTGVSNTIAVILAAGLGKRMGSNLPKVLAELNGKPLVWWVVDAVRAAGIQKVIVVIGHKGELVQGALSNAEVSFAWQRELLGTAHAVMQAEDQLVGHSGQILVLLGDAPLVRPETIRQVIELHSHRGVAATILSADIDDPSGYGRIVRQKDDLVERVVEDRDADDNIKRIKEINSGLICFSAVDLLSALKEVSNNNSQGEYYLTDVAAIFRGRNLPVAALKVSDPREIMGINSPDQLEMARLASSDFSAIS